MLDAVSHVSAAKLSARNWIARAVMAESQDRDVFLLGTKRSEPM